MFGERVSCVVSALPTPSSTPQNPLTPIIPALTAHFPLSPIIPALTRNPRGRGSPPQPQSTSDTLCLSIYQVNVGAPTFCPPALVAPASCLPRALTGRPFGSSSRGRR